MAGSIQIARIVNIPVKVHWSFGLLILWVLYMSLDAGLAIAGILLSVGFVLIVFLCVVLHEFGHALMARRFDVRTKDIIMSPIGGIARFSHIPEVPKQEMLIAIAGPAVNLVIALVLIVILALSVGMPSWALLSDLFRIETRQPLLLILAKLNLILLLFNLIPAFPMDGGRVLRAFLAQYVIRPRATIYASYVGRGLALVFIALGIWQSNVILSLIGIFVFFAAGRENAVAQTMYRLHGISAAEVCRRAFVQCGIDMTFASALAEANGRQVDALAVDKTGKVCGVLFREMFGPEMAPSLVGKTVGEIASLHYIPVAPEQTMDQVYRMFAQEGYRILPVVEDDHLVGVIDRKIIEELIDGMRTNRAGGSTGSPASS